MKSNFIDNKVPWFSTDGGSFVFWFVAKIIIWILPALWLLRISDNKLSTVFNFPNWRVSTIWGVGSGLIIALTGILPKLVNGHFTFLPVVSLALLNILVVAPVFEEFVLRGVFQNVLKQNASFGLVNCITSAMFLGLHLPGWYFVGTLVENLSRPVGGALSILALGFIFGYVAHKGKSVVGAMICHVLNNFGTLG